MHPSRAFGCLLACLALAPSARAQQAHPVADGAPSGYELALSGATRAERGSALRLFGTAYEVEGLADLRPRDGLTVEATITARIGSGSDRRVVTQASALTAGGGRFEVAIDVPSEPLSAPMVELVVHRGPQPGRRFTFGLSPLLGEELELLTDRNRYEPGERVRAWARVRDARSLAPRSGRAVRLTLSRNGERLATRDVTSGASGAVSAELVIPATAEAGGYEVRAEVLDPPGAQASRSVQVWRRTVERILAEVELRAADRDGVALVAPSGPLRGRVWARTPSGTPIRGARVELRVRHDAEPVTLVTGDDGAAPFDVRAPAFLSGDVGRETLTARVVHPAYGTITASAGYLMARVRAVVDATARGGALVPEVESTVYLSVSDPRGRPLRAGTEVVVRADGVAPNAQRAVDDRGYVEVPIRLPRGAASTLHTGPCAGRVATTLEVEVRTDPPAFSRVCVPVSAEALVLPRVTSAPILAPGDGIEVEIARRPAAASRAVLVEALWSGRAVAFAWAAPRESRVRLGAPARSARRGHGARARRERAGRARALHGARRERLLRRRVRRGAGAPERRLRARGGAGARALPGARAGRGGALGEPRAERARLGRAARARRGGARRRGTLGPLLLARRAARGGVAAGRREQRAHAARRALVGPRDRSRAARAAAARATLLGAASLSSALPLGDAGLARRAARSGGAARGAAPPRARPDRARARAGRLRARTGARRARRDRAGPRLPPGVIAHLVATRRLGDAAARSLGGEPLTVAMIESGDPGFSFETVARRVARARLARLLLALARLTDPDNPQAQRVSAPLPPDRWLGALVQLSMVPSRDLVDPWGHPFVLREVRGRRARVAVSERALEWGAGLARPRRAHRHGRRRGRSLRARGARGHALRGDERRGGAPAPLRDARARAPRAHADEPRLRPPLARRHRGAAGGPVTATGSETADELVAADLEEDLDGAEGGGGGGRGGGLAMQRSFAGQMPARQAPASPAPPPSAEPMAAAEAERQQRADAPADTRTAALGALVREDFPPRSSSRARWR
ncbi:MAG: MG2 domain-containing protein [Sandaracinaceae bacterium]|nr:MG2 domain-containing protein [Sandaracinaceae bacterium]